MNALNQNNGHKNILKTLKISKTDETFPTQLIQVIQTESILTTQIQNKP